MENQDVERIRNSVPGIDVVTATIAQWGVNIVREEYTLSTLKGLYPEYDKIEEPIIRMGRSLNETDIRDRRKRVRHREAYLRNALSQERQSVRTIHRDKWHLLPCSRRKRGYRQHVGQRTVGNLGGYPVHHHAAEL